MKRFTTRQPMTAFRFEKEGVKVILDPQKKIYKKKNPRAPFIKQIILYTLLMIVSFVVGQWKVGLVFIALIVFAAFMLRRKWNDGSYSLADYIHGYDNDFPTESPEPLTKKEAKDLKEKRRQEYDDYVAKVESDFDDFDYGDDEDDEDDEDEDDE